MLTARSVIIAVVTIAVLSLAGAVIELAQPPDSNGFGHDSYGTRAYGQRALYEILSDLKMPVERSFVPPGQVLRGDACLVLWSPDPDVVQFEPGYLTKVAEWVRGGGTLIVAPSNPGVAPRRLVPTGSRMRGVREVSPLDELGLRGAAITWFDPGKSSAPPPPSEPTPAPGTAKKKSPLGIAVSPLMQKAREYCSVSVTADGDLAPLGAVLATLQVPAEELRVLNTSTGPTPAGRIIHTASDGTVRTLVATYPLGGGKITVVADPALFLNESIAKADNAVLAAHLFHRCSAICHIALRGEAVAARHVVFDEFYHGLTIRGNPAWLLTRHPYGLFAAMLVLASVLWAWRESRHLGPPVPEKPASRRTMGEYVEAMANLFFRNGCRAFVLREVRDGVLWSLRRRLGLSPKRENVEDLARVLGRKDPQAAGRLQDAAAGVESLLQGKKPATEMLVVQTARKILRCL
ncbi:MAG: DUF4350 domain-containing protein [Planctomycetota bacterium]|nr:DUF4350 domain-containing protein [Planctomycetota bacterium]